MPNEQIIDQTEKTTPDADDWIFIQENSGSNLCKKIKRSNLVGSGIWSYHTETSFFVDVASSASFSLAGTCQMAVVRKGNSWRELDSSERAAIRGDVLGNAVTDYGIPMGDYFIIIPAFSTGPYLWDTQGLANEQTLEISAAGLVTIVNNSVFSMTKDVEIAYIA